MNQAKHLIKGETTTGKLGYYVSPPVYNQLMNGKDKVVKGNLDRIYVIDGREGEGGKSTLAMQLAYAQDPTLSLDNIVFKSRDFQTKIRELDKYKALIFDESFRGLSSKSALSKQNKKLISLLQECRQRNLFVYIVLPSIFQLEVYVSVFRSQALFHAYCSKKDSNRRYFKVYNYQGKKELYRRGKKLLSYRYPKVRKTHRFYAKLPPTIDRKAYDDKKMAAFMEDDDDRPEESKHIQQRNFLLWFLNKNSDISYKEASELLKKEGLFLDSSVIGKIIRDYKVNVG